MPRDALRVDVMCSEGCDQERADPGGFAFKESIGKPMRGASDEICQDVSGEGADSEEQQVLEAWGRSDEFRNARDHGEEPKENEAPDR